LFSIWLDCSVLWFGKREGGGRGGGGRTLLEGKYVPGEQPTFFFSFVQVFSLYEYV